MKGFEREIDTELFSGLFGGSGLFYGLFPKKVEHPCFKTSRRCGGIQLDFICSLCTWLVA